MNQFLYVYIKTSTLLSLSGRVLICVVQQKRASIWLKFKVGGNSYGCFQSMNGKVNAFIKILVITRIRYDIFSMHHLVSVDETLETANSDSGALHYGRKVEGRTGWCPSAVHKQQLGNLAYVS